MTLDATDLVLLSGIQTGFPLVPRPFAPLAATLGLSESEVLERVARLHRRGLIRRIGPVLDPERVGRLGALAAMAVPDERLEAAAAVVSACPNVTHNYQRVPLNGSCPYNLWFTLTASSQDALDEAVAAIGEATGLLPHVLPVRRKFKIGVRFRFSDEAEPVPRPHPHPTLLPERERGQAASTPPPFQGGGRGRVGHEVSPLDRRILRELQDGLPIVAEPYADVAARLGMPVEALLGRLAAMLDRGEVRRFGASIAHRRAGIAANVMCVWRVPPDEVDAFACEAVQFGAITHCYERATTPEWPYNLYCMIHGRAQADCEAVIRDLCQRTGQADYIGLLSTREFKKTWTRL